MKTPTGDEIKEVRKKAGLSKTQAGESVWVKRVTWGRWENETRKMSLAHWELFHIKHKIKLYR